MTKRWAMAVAVLAAAFGAWAEAYTLSPDRTSYNGSVQAGATAYAGSDSCSIVVPDGQYAILSLRDEGFRWHHCQRASFRAYVDGLQLKLGDSITLDGDATLSISASATGDSYRDPYVISRYGSVAGASFPIYTYRDYPYTDYYYIQNYSVSVSYRRKLPDLYVSAVSLSDNAVAVDEKVRLDFTVRNGGRLAAIAHSIARVYDGSRLVTADITIGALAAGASSDHTVELSRLSAGSHDIKVVVDADDRIEEANEANNEAVGSLRAYTRTAVGVTYDLNGGGKPATVSIVAGNLLTILPNVKRTGYDFLGWWTDANGGSEIKVGEKITHPTTFYAHWKPRTTDIVFNRRSGSGGTRTAFATFDASLPSITPPTRTGYDFDGYWTEPNGGGEQIYSAAGTGLAKWRIDQSDAVLYAKWTGRPVKLALDRQGGQGGALSANAVYCEVPPQISVPSRTGWLFHGYFTKPGGEGVRYYDERGAGIAVVASADDHTLYAHWLPVNMECTLAFDLQGGTGAASAKAIYGEVFPTIAAPVRDGYAFKGYFAEPDGNGKQYSNADGTGATLWDGAATIRLYAKWEKAYRVVLDPNGADGVPTTYYFTHPTWELAANAFTSNGCVFAGWALEPDGAPVYPDGAVLGKELLGYSDDPDAEPATLYAAWGKPLTTDLFPGFSFVTGGAGENGGWLVEDGKLRSGHTSEASWLCTTFHGFGELTYFCTNAVFTFFNAGGVRTNTCNGTDFESGLGGVHLAVWTTTKESWWLTDDESKLHELFLLRQQELGDAIEELGNALFPIIHYDNRYMGEESCRDVCISYVKKTVEEWRINRTYSSYSTYSRYGSSTSYQYAGLLHDIVYNMTAHGYKVSTLVNYMQHGTTYAFEINDKAVETMNIVDELNAIVSYIATYGDLRNAEWNANKILWFTEKDYCDTTTANRALEEEERIRWRYRSLIEPICNLIVPYRQNSSEYVWATSIKEILEDVLNGKQDLYFWHDSATHGPLITYVITKLGAGGKGYNVYNLNRAVANNNIDLKLLREAEILAKEIRELEQCILDSGIREYRICGQAERIGALPAPESRDGYTFDGWFDEDGEMVDENTKVTEDMLLHTKWSLNKYSVSFNVNGGTSVAAQTVEHGERIALPPAPVRNGYVFEGWYCDADGNEAADDNAVATTNTTFFALWTPDVSSPVLEKAAEANFDWNSYSGDSQDAPISPCLYETTEGSVPALANVYDGYLYNKTTGAMVGTIQVKVGKPNKKTRLASVKATVQLAGQKKPLKAAGGGKEEITTDGPTTVSLAGGEVCEVTLGAEGLSGFYGDYDIDGARNFFTSKDKGEQSAANDVLAKWLGPVNAAWDGGTASASIGKKGKAKVAVTLADGTTATATAQLLVGEEWLCVPVVVTKKTNLAFTLWLPSDGGEALAEGLPDGAKVGKPGALKSGAKFHVGKTAALWSQMGILTDYLPDGLSVESGARWTVADGARAGKVAYLRGTTEIDEAKLGTNPSALKLSYKAKDGSFKGSFKVYADANGRLKATKVDVAGVVVDSVGRGSATVKKVGYCPVSIENGQDRTAP